jgi:3-deoxy-D-manno-octulosonic-acid transferase
MIFIYDLLYVIALLLIFPFEYLKRPKDLRKTWLSEKTGSTGNGVGRDRKDIWIHAVSVGEVLAALPLIEKLRESGHSSVLLSTITDTGRQIATEKAPDGVEIMYLPFDLKIFLNKAIRFFSPRIFMTMETEIWPNLFTSMKDAGIPVFIFNGRISDRSFHRYKKIRFFLKKLFRAVEVAGMQTSQDAERIRAMGMDDDKVKTIGNFKFDIQDTLQAPEWTERLEGTNIVAGSTHEGEEELIVDTYLKLRSDHDPLNLILAPRHPQRFRNVENLLMNRKVNFIKRSVLDEHQGALKDAVVLIDTLGELSGLYSVASVCIIGGSFVPVGGHNLFEAAYWSKPVVCGKHMNNFPLTKDFERNDAVRIADKDALYDILFELLNSRESRETLGRNAHNLFLENRGAAEKAIGLLDTYISRIKK